MKEEDKDLNYWKENAKDAYMTTPICVLRYITELEKAVKNNAVLPLVSKRYFLFECVNADKQKLNKLIIADDKESAIADLETNYPYIERWYTIEELNVC